MTKSLVEFLKQDANGQRLGQRFCNLYIKDAWPELYYANDEDAVQLIQFWLIDHNYEEELPCPLNNG